MSVYLYAQLLCVIFEILLDFSFFFQQMCWSWENKPYNLATEGWKSSLVFLGQRLYSGTIFRFIFGIQSFFVGVW